MFIRSIDDVPKIEWGQGTSQRILTKKTAWDLPSHTPWSARAPRPHCSIVTTSRPATASAAGVCAHR